MPGHPDGGISDAGSMTPIDAIAHPVIAEYAAGATEFIRGFHWCAGVREGYLAYGVPELFAVFLFRVAVTRSSIPETIWVVVHHTPKAFSVCDRADDWRDALGDFLGEMRRWIRSAANNDAAALEKHLEHLKRAYVYAAPSEPGDSSSSCVS